MTDYSPKAPEYPRIAELVTYQDCVDRVLTYYNRPNQDRDRYLARQAVANALSDLSNSRCWKWYINHWTFKTTASYSTGTIAYDHTAGSSERLVTLTSGTWPTDAADGELRIVNTSYSVAERLGNTTLTLREDSNPGADVAAGTSYLWYRDKYTRPSDWWKEYDPVDVALKTGGPDMVYREPEYVLSLTRAGCVVPITCPQIYSFVRDPRRQGLVWMCAPPPSTSRTYQFIYQRFPRPLTTDKYSTGTITTTAGSTTVAGTGTAWTSAHLGTVLRISSGTTLEPTSQYGNLKSINSLEMLHNPAAETRIVMKVNGTTSVTVDQAVSSAWTGVKYTLSDPLDVDWTIASKYFQRQCEYEFAQLGQDFKKQRELMLLAKQEWHEAAAADQRDASVNKRTRPGWWAAWSMWADANNVSTAYTA